MNFVCNPSKTTLPLAKWRACKQECAFFGHVLQRAENMCLVGVVAFASIASLPVH